MSITRERVRKEGERSFTYAKRPAWGCLFVSDDTSGVIVGARLKWFDGPWSSSPEEHLTDDGGITFKRVTSSLLPPDWLMNKDIGEIETDPEKLLELPKVWAAYREAFGGPVFVNAASAPH
jgi:hypothetical protein